MTDADRSHEYTLKSGYPNRLTRRFDQLFCRPNRQSRIRFHRVFHSLNLQREMRSFKSLCGRRQILKTQGSGGTYKSISDPLKPVLPKPIQQILGDLGTMIAGLFRLHRRPSIDSGGSVQTSQLIFVDLQDAPYATRIRPLNRVIVLLNKTPTLARDVWIVIEVTTDSLAVERFSNFSKRATDEIFAKLIPRF